jgi:hypothetical protein
MGTLNLPLLTPTRTAFRLSAAHFVIKNSQGTQLAALDSDSNPDAQALTVSLTQGSYNVLLQDGWVLTSIAEDGTERQMRAALLSVNPQTFEIKASTPTSVSFTFSTESGTITIGNGPVNITFDVAPTPGSTQCYVTQGYGCPSGQTCLLADSTGRTFCASPGMLAVGSPCTSEQCVAGSQCMKLDADHPDDGVCTQFCDTSSTTFGCNCVNLGITNSSIGACVAPPASACDLLAQTGCADGQACQYTGGNFGTCGAPGTTGPGETCSAETCMAGYQCYGGLCRGFCDLRGSSNNCNFGFCTSAGTGFVGRCYYY